MGKVLSKLQQTIESMGNKKSLPFSPEHGDLELSRLMAQAEEATALAKLVSDLDGTSFSVKLHRSCFSGENVNRDTNTNSSETEASTEASTPALVLPTVASVSPAFTLNARTYNAAHYQHVVIGLTDGDTENFIPLPHFFLLHSLLSRLENLYSSGAVAQQLTADGANSVMVNENDTESERLRQLEKKKREIAFDNECPCCLDRQINTVCSSCSTGICTECAEKWKLENGSSGCFVCRSTSERNDWQLESWTMSDLQASSADLKKQIADAVQTAIAATREDWMREDFLELVKTE